MDLNSYLTTRSAAAFAKAINVHPAQLSQWRTGVRPIPAEHAPAIERESGGMVTCEEICPQVDWTYVRNTSTAEREKKAA